MDPWSVSFIQRAVSIWNSLPEEMVEATVTTLEVLDRYLNEQETERSEFNAMLVGIDWSKGPVSTNSVTLHTKMLLMKPAEENLPGICFFKLYIGFILRM